MYLVIVKIYITLFYYNEFKNFKPNRGSLYFHLSRSSYLLVTKNDSLCFVFFIIRS